MLLIIILPTAKITVAVNVQKGSIFLFNWEVYLLFK